MLSPLNAPWALEPFAAWQAFWSALDAYPTAKQWALVDQTTNVVAPWGWSLTAWGQLVVPATTELLTQPVFQQGVELVATTFATPVLVVLGEPRPARWQGVICAVSSDATVRWFGTPPGASLFGYGRASHLIYCSIAQVLVDHQPWFAQTDPAVAWLPLTRAWQTSDQGWLRFPVRPTNSADPLYRDLVSGIVTVHDPLPAATTNRLAAAFHAAALVIDGGTIDAKNREGAVDTH